MEFWNLTPHEFSLVVKSHYERMKFEHDERITMAYLSAYWAAQWFSKKKPEKLDKILNKKHETKSMTDQQMFNNVMLLHKALGGE